MNKVPLIKPTLMGKKTIFKTDTIPTKGSNNIVTSDALAQALQDKVVNKEEEGEKTIVPTGDIIIGKLLEDGFYIEDPTFLGTRLIKIETPTPGKFYYDKTTHTYYTFQGYSETGYKFKPVVLSNLTELTWQELKDLRNDSRLIPGSLYRITDYQCTTTQADTRSAGHQFDIVLLALSEDKLAEEGWAMMHDNIYDVTFSDGVTKQCYIYFEGTDYYIIDIITMRGYGGVITDNDLEVNEQLKTAISDNSSSILTDENYPYNYFQNSNLSAWKVWYSLDNDKSRFAWADDSVRDIENVVVYYPEFTGFGVTTPAHDVVYTLTNETQIANGVTYFKLLKLEGQGDGFINIFVDTKNINTETTLYIINSVFGTTNVQASPSGISIKSINYNTPPTEEGRGVIYRLIDEFNNDIKYDFKNIQFKRTITDGQYDENGTETWCYTLNVWYQNMCQDASIVGNTLPNDDGYINGVYDNNFGYATAYDFYIEGVSTFAFALGNNVVLSFNDDGYLGINSNTIGNKFYQNTIGNKFYSNTAGDRFCDNTIGNDFNYNMIGNSFVGNTIGDNINGKNYGNDGVELATK